MILDCPTCQTLVEAEVLHASDGKSADSTALRHSLAKCPHCQAVLLALQMASSNGAEKWAPPVRVYPASTQLGEAVPAAIRKCYAEARTCFQAQAFTASAVMCRKALKGLCAELGVGSRTLGLGLKELCDRGTIDARLFEAGETLHIFGSEVARDVNVTTSAEEAKNILDLTDALLEYAFTLRAKLAQLEQRWAGPR